MLAEEPVMDIAHLGHVELLTPRPEESLRFFRDVMGMTVSGKKGDSVFQRGWDDYERYSLQFTASRSSGMGHAAFRTRSAPALERRLAALRAEGCEATRVEDSFGHGPAWRFRDPDGHAFELYWETEWYDAPADRRPALKNQPERYPARGVNVLGPADDPQLSHPRHAAARRHGAVIPRPLLRRTAFRAARDASNPQPSTAGNS
jgi:catechol 2,3-dioxygenase